MFIRSWKLNYHLLAVLLGATLVAVSCLFPSGAAPVSAPAQPELKLPVAMYHHILADSARWNDYTISPEQFEEDLRYIQSCGYTAISTGELLAWAEEGASLPPKPILITFDDGYESFHEYAYPLLQKYGMKAVVSIIGTHTDLFSQPQEYTSVAWSHLTWDQCREMQASGLVEVQNHTYDLHGNGSGERFGIRIRQGESVQEYQSALLEDVGGLNEKIRQELGSEPVAFAYPFGVFCPESGPVLEGLGFKLLFTCEEKVNILTQRELPLILKRFNRPHSDSTRGYFKKLGVLPPSQEEGGK
ncbi:MAG: polysaccharide deacetylase family protein [Oscillospiraceae bacterium]|nr:polysaccharide deacetylase family protein [Oscillospiraceae bacterium]